MPVIKAIQAREILDCRGVPTIEANLWLDNGISVTTAVPTSIYTGKHEAMELRDGDPLRYAGLGVIKAVNLINTTIAQHLIGRDPSQQGDIDRLLIQLDGTPDKHQFGANTMLAVSQAVCKAGAAMYHLPVYAYLAHKYRLVYGALTIPTPAFNVINGGKHGAGNLDFQEFLLVPSSRFRFDQGLQIGVEIFYELERQLINKNAIHSVGVEGGFAPNLFTNLDALEIIIQTIQNTNHQYGHDVFLGLDVAASTFQKGSKYAIKDRSQPFSGKEFVSYYQDLNDDYHIFSLEDPFGDDDWRSWIDLTMEMGQKVLIIGDDLITSNKERLIKAIRDKACTAVLVKPNQIGTITESVEVVKIAKDAHFTVMASCRSGETTDTFIADFAVGVGAEYAKFGAPSRGERIIKYNRLLRIEAELNPQTQGA
ncbi:phosphopyruvate hydratase [Microgenomates group bacterium RBG_16_45_19]|nr:MAG: phosphopyruvate hydratase [Microgenomates group bacterium RBG_16_45_19]